MVEIWKAVPIKKYEGLYEVSNKGNVRGLDRVLNDGRQWKGRLLSHSVKKDGHHQVCLMKDGKAEWYCVHRLVAMAFIPNPDGLPMINHKDENPHNNDYRNLEWCDEVYNCNYGTRNQRIADKQRNDPNKSHSVEVLLNNGEMLGTYKSIAEACRQYG